MPPETRYAKSGELNIAYQVAGEGAFDLLYVPGWVSHVEGAWEQPELARFLDRLASFSRLILLDKRGTGLSDRVPASELPTLEQRMDDVRAVLEAVGSKRAVLFGVSEGGPMCALFAATYPARTNSLVLDEIEEFLTGVRRGPDPDRVLVTLLFTDIVGSTDRAAELGDRAWRELVDRHHALVRDELARWQGRELDTAGDGFLAEFGGPARAIRCARAIATGVRALGLEVRAGVHTGEAERAGEALRGIAVHIGARVASKASSGELLVSRTVKDLVAGAGIEFEDRGEHELKGVPDPVRLYAVVP